MTVPALDQHEFRWSSETFYHKLCFAHIQPVLDSLMWFRQETDVWFEVTTLLIPGHNDSDTEIDHLTSWFIEHLGPDVPLHFSAFHPDFKMMDVPRTPPERLTRARAIARRKGIRCVYTGNVHDHDGDTTLCPSCGAEVIVRDWYNLLHYDIRKGSCGQCGHPIPGVFEDQPGTWGALRRRVDIVKLAET